MELGVGGAVLAASTAALALAHVAAGWSSGGETSGVGVWHGALLGYAVAGAWSPPALLRSAGAMVSSGFDAYLASAASAAMVALAGLAWSRAPWLPILLGVAGLALKTLSPIAALLAPAALATPLRASRAPAIGGFLAGLAFEAVSVAHVAVYAGAYMGLRLLEGAYLAPLLAALVLVALGLERGAAPRYGASSAGLVAAAALLLAIPVTLAPLAPESGPGGEAGVATYNLHQGFTADGRLNGLELARALSGLPPLLCLQEVDAGRATSAYIDVPVLLSSLGYYVEFQPAIAGHYGVAVALHGGELERLASGTLPGVDSEERAWLAVDAGGFTVVTLHLGLTPRERLIQAEILFERLEGEGLRPTVLCGDFNEDRGPATRVILDMGYVRLEPVEGPRYTCCLGEETRVSIDHIYALEGSEPSRWIARIVYVEASDHLPVAAEP